MDPTFTLPLTNTPKPNPYLAFTTTLKDGIGGSRGDFNSTHLTAHISLNTQEFRHIYT